MAESTLFVFRSVLRICSYFNPRTPVGCDLNGMAGIIGGSLFQSTHPSGVRLNPYGIRDVAVSFQSTHPSGVRLYSIHLISSDFVFQSTHPSGVRPAVMLDFHQQDDFNPRTPVGCDARRDRRLDRAMRISIHAPQWGATARYTPSMTIREEFQSTHPSGVRPDRMPLCEGLAEISIHAPQWGATVYD